RPVVGGPPSAETSPGGGADLSPAEQLGPERPVRGELQELEFLAVHLTRRAPAAHKRPLLGGEPFGPQDVPGESRRAEAGAEAEPVAEHEYQPAERPHGLPGWATLRAPAPGKRTPTRRPAFPPRACPGRGDQQVDPLEVGGVAPGPGLQPTRFHAARDDGADV